MYTLDGALVDSKYFLNEDIFIQTQYYPTGKLRSESIQLHRGTQVAGQQYLDWYENGNIKKLETYGSQKLTWFSNGVFDQAQTYTKRFSYAVPDSVVVSLEKINEITAVLRSGTERNLNWIAPDGPVKSWYGPGKVKIETFLKGGVPDQYINTYYYSGKPMHHFSIRNGQLNGDFLFLSEEGKVLRKGTFTDGLKSGDWLYANLIGDTIEYFQLKRPVYEPEQKVMNRKMTFVPNGALGREKTKLESEFYESRDSIVDFLMYHENGRRASFRQERKRLPIGPFRRYWPNGKVAESYERDKKGRKQGDSYTTFEPGFLVSTYQFFVNDTIHGEARISWPNGKLKSKGFYNKGLQNGEWQFFDSLGNVTKTEKYVKGVLQIQAISPPGCVCKSTPGFSLTEKLPLTELIDVQRLNVWQFPFHQSITQDLLKSYFRDHSNDFYPMGDESTRLIWVAHSEVSTRIPKLNGFELVLNPCALYQEESRAWVEIYCDKNNKESLTVSYKPEKMAFRFSNRLLKPLVPNKRNATDAWFDLEELHYYQDGFQLINPIGHCFTPSYFTGTNATLTLSEWTPALMEDQNLPAFSIREFMKKQGYNPPKEFTGIVDGSGFLGKKGDPNIRLWVQNMLISHDMVAGEIGLIATKTTAAGYLYPVGNKELTEAQLLAELKKLLPGKTIFLPRSNQKILTVSFLFKY